MRKITFLVIIVALTIGACSCKSVNTGTKSSPAVSQENQTIKDQSVIVSGPNNTQNNATSKIDGSNFDKTQSTVLEPITVTYSIDQNSKTIVFLQNNIKLKLGQLLIVIKDQNVSGDTILGGDFYKTIDITREYSQVADSSIYSFKGFSEGTTVIEFKYTSNSQIKGQLNIEVIPSKDISGNIIKPIKVNYNINNKVANFEKTDAIEFSQKTIELEVGQKVILAPDDSMQDSQIMASQYGLKELSQTEIYLLDGTKKRVFVYKAEEAGKVNLKFNVAHAAFMKGSIDVIVKNK